MSARDEIAMPPKDRVGADQQPQPAQNVPRHLVKQRGQQRPVTRVELRPLVADLALQHHDLMALVERFGPASPLPPAWLTQLRDAYSMGALAQAA